MAPIRPLLHKEHVSWVVQFTCGTAGKNKANQLVCRTNRNNNALTGLPWQNGSYVQWRKPKSSQITTVMVALSALPWVSCIGGMSAGVQEVQEG